MAFQYPLWFELDPADVDFGARAKRTLCVRRTIAAPAAVLFDHIVHLRAPERWLAYYWSHRFLGDDHEGPGVSFDETFRFMTIRVRTIEHRVGERWVASIDRISVPLATRMSEDITFASRADGTEVTWLLHFDPPKVLMPVAPLVLPFFRDMFSRSLRRLAALTEVSPPIPGCHPAGAPLRDPSGDRARSSPARPTRGPPRAP